MRALPGLLLMAAGFASMAAQTTGDAPAGWRPEAIVDLRTPQGAQLVHGQWRYRDAQVVQVDSSTYYSGFIGVPANVHKQGLGLAVAGWGPDFPTEYGFFESIVDGRAIKQAGNSNYSEFNSKEVNDLIDQAQSTTDVSKRNDAWGKVDHLVMEGADYLPFVADKALDYRNPRLTNVYMDQAFGMYDYVNIGVGS